MHRRICLAVAVLCMPAIALASPLFESDMDTSAGWNVRNQADTAYQFGWDFTTMGIPASPGGSTTGLKMEANISAGSAAYVWAVTEDTFTGQYVVEFDFWANTVGPFPAGGTGSTEFLGGGVGRADDPPVYSMNGASLIVTNEGGSSRDYRMYKDAGEQYIASGQYDAESNNCSDPYYATYPALEGQEPPEWQQMNYPEQVGPVQNGAPAFGWHHMVITADTVAGTANFAIDGLSIGTLDTNIGNPVEIAGHAQLIYADKFSSVSENAELTFGVFDNFVVTPEPMSALLLAFGALALRRRR